MTRLVGFSITEVAFVVCTELDSAGVTAVLVGGGAATVYAPEAYTTRDLDFVLQLAISSPSAGPILKLGFKPSASRGVYEHPDIPFTLEFLPAPLAVGGDEIESWDTLREKGRVLYIITPLDCAKDRMAAAIHWKDPDSARQAAAVARAQAVDIDELSR